MGTNEELELCQYPLPLQQYKIKACMYRVTRVCWASCCIQVLSDVLQILCHALQLSIDVFSQFVAAEHTGTKVRMFEENFEDLLALTPAMGNLNELPHLQPRLAETREQHPERLHHPHEATPKPLIYTRRQKSKRVEDFLEGFVRTEGNSEPRFFKIPYLLNQTLPLITLLGCITKGIRGCWCHT